MHSEQHDGDWTLEELREAINSARDSLAKEEGFLLTNDAEFDAFFDDIKREGRQRLRADHPER